MSAMVTIIIVALIVQFLVERVKSPIPEAARYWAVPLIALFFAELICILGKIDILAYVGVPIEPVLVAYILTGIAVSGGSTAINELIKAIADARKIE